MSDENENGSVKYPECVVQLTGVDGNSVTIFMAVRKGLIKYLTQEEDWERENAILEADAFVKEATSGGPGDVLATAFRWVNIV